MRATLALNALTRSSLWILDKIQTIILSSSVFLVKSLINKDCYKSRTSNDIDIKLWPTSKIEKKNTMTSKKLENNIISTKYDVVVIFSIYGQYGAMLKTNSLILGFSLMATSYPRKLGHRTKSLTQPWYYCFERKYYYWLKLLTFCKKVLTSAKLSGSLYHEVKFVKLHMCLYLRTQFQVSNKILTRFTLYTYLKHCTKNEVFH